MREQAALTPGEIATFVGRKMRGSSILNQLHRDCEVADWLRQNVKTGLLQ